MEINGWGYESANPQFTIISFRASLRAQLGKNPPAMQETLVRFLGSGRSAGEWIGYPLQYSWTSLVAWLVKNLPTMRKTWVRSLGWEDPLEKGKATHSSKELDMTECLSFTCRFYRAQVEDTLPGYTVPKMIRLLVLLQNTDHSTGRGAICELDSAAEHSVQEDTWPRISQHKTEGLWSQESS